MSTLQLKVSLQFVRPTIWRRIRVPSVISFADLHEVLQIAMGWTNSHLHEFVVDGEPLGDPGEIGENPEELATKLDRLVDGEAFEYTYDFGDSWAHDIVVEKIDALGTELAPVCLAGERACPPEDCGGPPGYEDILAALKKPKTSRAYKEVRQTFGNFDPADLSIPLVNRALRTLVPTPPQPRAKSARVIPLVRKKGS